mgnify:CR=1 FL=1
MESGHAYGKSLRTVKSCVGSTWCRYGVDDSVGLAIELENRYKGLRAPHKIKLGVSGCTRECAEAQGKDVGVIATDIASAYNADVITGIEDATDGTGYSVLLAHGRRDGKILGDRVRQMLQLGVDGLIIVSSRAPADVVSSAAAGRSPLPR